MAKKLTRRQEIELAIQKEDALIALLQEEDEKDIADTAKAIEDFEQAADGAVKGVQGTPQEFGDLTISWTEDGVQRQLGPYKRQVDINKFKSVLRKLPIAIAADIRRRIAPLGARPKTPRELSRDAQRRHQERQGKIFHAEERKKTLVDMIPPVVTGKKAWDDKTPWR